MAKFKFAVSGHFLDLLTPTKGVDDNLYINTAEFDFRSPEWEDAEKWAHFTSPDYEDGKVFDFNLVDDKIAGERGLNLTAGMWEVYVHGEIFNNGECIKRLVTTGQTIQILTSEVINGHPLGDIPLSSEEQIDAKATAALNARITSATADIDDTTGTPSVDVDITGEDRTKQLDFHFHGLKGETGERGPIGDSGVYIATTEPEDPVKNVWINPEGAVGKVIMSWSMVGTHQPGTYDVYTFLFSDETSLELQVYNGVDGEGTGDMIKSIYDPTNQSRDVFAAIAAAVAGKADTAGLAAVATSGSYNDLTDKPTIPPVDSAMSDSSTNAVQNSVIKAYVDEKTGPECFVATYGTTTYAEIAAAVADGKVVVLKQVNSVGTNFIALLRGLVTSSAYFVVPGEGDGGNTTYILTYRVTSGDVWSTEYKYILNSNNVLQTLQNNQAPVSGAAVTAALAGKQDALTIDSAMSSTSQNPVANSVIKTYVDSKVPKSYMVRTFTFTQTVDIPAGANYTGSISVAPNPWSWASQGGREAYDPSSGKQGYRFRGVAGFYNNWLMPMTIVYLDGDVLRYNIKNTSGGQIDCTVKIDLFYTNDVAV